MKDPITFNPKCICPLCGGSLTFIQVLAVDIPLDQQGNYKLDGKKLTPFDTSLQCDRCHVMLYGDRIVKINDHAFPATAEMELPYHDSKLNPFIRKDDNNGY